MISRLRDPVLRITLATLALLAPTRALADAANGTLDVTTSDNLGEVTVDGKKVGEGSYRAELPPGEHEVVVKRLGFKPYAKKVVVEAGKVVNVGVTLEHVEAAPPPPPPPETFGGLFGGFFLGPSLSPTGMRGTLDQSCSLIGAVKCDGSGPVGFVLAANVGYTWDPIGVELFAAFGIDASFPTATFDGTLTLSAVGPNPG